MIFRIYPSCQLSHRAVSHASGVCWRWAWNPFFLSSPLGQPPARNAPPTRPPGAGICEHSGRKPPLGWVGSAGSLHRVTPPPRTHPARPDCPGCATPPGSGRRGSPRRASENLEPAGKRLGSGPGCGGGGCCCCFLVLSSPSGGEREPAEAGARGAGGGGGRDAKAGASRTGRSCSPGRLSARPRRRGESRALREDDREPSSPPRARSPAPLLSTFGERAGGKEGRGRSLGGGGMAGRRGLGRCFSPELPLRPWQRRGLL